MMFAPSGVPMPLCVGWRYVCISVVDCSRTALAVRRLRAVGMPNGRILPLVLSFAPSDVVSIASDVLSFGSSGMLPVAIRWSLSISLRMVGCTMGS